MFLIYDIYPNFICVFNLWYISKFYIWCLIIIDICYKIKFKLNFFLFSISPFFFTFSSVLFSFFLEWFQKSTLLPPRPLYPNPNPKRTIHITKENPNLRKYLLVREAWRGKHIQEEAHHHVLQMQLHLLRPKIVRTTLDINHDLVT